MNINVQLITIKYQLKTWWKNLKSPYITLTWTNKFTATPIYTSNILNWVYKYIVKTVKYNAEPIKVVLRFKK